MKTLLIAVFALTVGVAYGDYFIEGIRAGADLIEQQRQS